MQIKATLQRLMGAVLIAAAALLAPAIPAAAHVTVSPSEASAEGYAKLDFSVGHGCEASPTTSISIQMPDQVVSATPQVVPGWKIETQEGKLAQPVESHGETITTGVREVTWRGGPLDPHQLEIFGLSVRFVGSAGDAVPFKVVQRCREGENAWIELAERGQPEPESPAPVVTLVATADDHGHSDADAHSDAGDTHADEGADATNDIAVTTDDAVNGSQDDASSDDGDGPLPVIALVISILALIAAGAALLTRRR